MNGIYRIPDIQGRCFQWLAQVLKAESGARGNCARRGENVRAVRTASAFPRTGDYRLSVLRTSRLGEGGAAGGDALQVLQLHALRHGDQGVGAPHGMTKAVRTCPPCPATSRAARRSDRARWPGPPGWCRVAAAQPLGGPCQQPRVIFQRDRQDPQIGVCIDGEQAGQLLFPVEDPVPAMGVVFSGVGVAAAEKGAAHSGSSNERQLGVPRPATCDVQRPPWQQSFRVVTARAPPQFPARLARRPRNDCPPSRRFQTDQWYATRAGSPVGRVAARGCKLAGR